MPAARERAEGVAATRAGRLAEHPPRAPAAATLALLGFAALLSPALADQDDVAERVPAGAGEVYSPIATSFIRQSALPGGHTYRLRDAQGGVPTPDGPVLFQDAKARLSEADPFWRDAIVNLYFRTHYLDRDNAGLPPPQSQAWAGGSAIGFHSGFFDDWLAVEAAVASSQPLYAPEGEGGTLLLTQNQAEVSSVMLANAHLRGFGQELAIGRQLFKTPYINPQDNRMLPNAVEGAILERRRDEAQVLDYGIGYLWGFKARDSSYFVPFSQELGLPEDRGIYFGGVKWVPVSGLTLGAIDYTLPDVLNTVFAEADWLLPKFDNGVHLRFSLNYTEQSTIGEQLLAAGSYSTSQVSARFVASYEQATAIFAVSSNGRDADIQGPFGSFPAYTVLDQLNFNNAGETTLVVGAAYDFSNLITDGLKMQARYGEGWGVVDPLTGGPLSRQKEVNVELEYDPRSGPFENLHLQLFYSGVLFPANAPGERSQPQYRSVVTYLVPLL
jgi:hypothetical protein